MADSSGSASNSDSVAVNKKSELVLLRRRVAELESDLAEAQERALAWARFYASASVTIGSIKNQIPSNYRKQGIAFEDLAHRILLQIKNQPEQLDATKMLVGAVIARLVARLESRIQAQSSPLNTQELRHWLASQADEWK